MSTCLKGDQNDTIIGEFKLTQALFELGWEGEKKVVNESGKYVYHERENNFTKEVEALTSKANSCRL